MTQQQKLSRINAIGYIRDLYPRALSQGRDTLFKELRRYPCCHGSPNNEPTVKKNFKKESTVTGLEPAIPRSEVWCLIH